MDKHIIKAEFTMDELVGIIMAMQFEIKRLEESDLKIERKHAKSLKSALDKIDRPGGTKSV